MLLRFGEKWLKLCCMLFHQISLFINQFAINSDVLNLKKDLQRWEWQAEGIQKPKIFYISIQIYSKSTEINNLPSFVIYRFKWTKGFNRVDFNFSLPSLPNYTLKMFSELIAITQQLIIFMYQSAIKSKYFFSNFSDNPHEEALPKFDNSIRTLKISHYVIGENIGMGGFGNVYKAFDLLTKAEAAVKVIEVSSLNSKNREHLIDEISILKTVNHPNIVKCYQIVEGYDLIFIFMELIKGKELYRLIAQKGHLTQRTALRIFQQICYAVQYIHELGIYHRDIKAENVMIEQDCNVKLIDFGLAKNDRRNQFQMTLCGSPPYKSPQLLLKNLYSAKKNDIWSLGVLLFTMVQGKYPFPVISKSNIAQNWSQANFQTQYKEYKDKIRFSSNYLRKIYEKIFVGEKKRININDLIEYIKNKEEFICERRLFPIIFDSQSSRKRPSQQICNFSVEGRSLNYPVLNQKKLMISQRKNTYYPSQQRKKVISLPFSLFDTKNYTVKRRQRTLKSLKNKRFV